MSGRPLLNHSLQSESHPSARNDYASFTTVEETKSSPSTPSEPVTFETLRDDVRDPRSTVRIIDQSANAKVAIPRLDLPVANQNSRVSRACHNCRKQKNKCSGHRPTCLRCQENSTPCVYVDGKRERNAKHLTAVTSQLEQYETLVREIYPKVDLEVARFVDQALGKISGLSLSSPTTSTHPDENVPNDSPTPSPVPCMEHTLEDFNADTSLQATGFLGEHSARAWLYRLKRLIALKNFATTNDQADISPHLSLASCGFFLDESSISLGNGLDTLAYPTQIIADELVDRYFKVAHASFPLIGKEIFLNQCRSFYSKPTVQPGVKWMALLNIVFAIAAKHSELMGDRGRIDHNTHMVYFSRAWKLSMNENTMLEHPNLQQTQIEGLFSLYFLTTGQINRAWRMCGNAIQSAIAMGIQLRSDSLNITHVSKETRYRLWWALYLLDTLLCVTTGRMPRMHREHCTTPLPVPYKDESFWDEQVIGVIQDNQARASLVASFLASNSPGQSDLSPGLLPSPHQQSSPVRQLRANLSPYLLYSIDLATVMREAIEILYAPEAVGKSGAETQQAMKSLNNAAENWFARLPAAYRFTDTSADSAVARQRTSLAFQYYSTKLVLSQPVLRFLSSVEDSFNVSHSQMGVVCFNAASQMVDLLPNEPNVAWLLGYSPWWCALHYLTQSIVMLITQLVIMNYTGGNTDPQLLERVQKVHRWLSELSTRDPAFERAWLIFTELLSTQGFNVGIR